MLLGLLRLTLLLEVIIHDAHASYQKQVSGLLLWEFQRSQRVPSDERLFPLALSLRQATANGKEGRGQETSAFEKFFRKSRGVNAVCPQGRGVDRLESKPSPTPRLSWRNCRLTVYHSRFEGRRAANGLVFRHSERTVACRFLPLGSRIQLRYWSGRRWVATPVTVTDRGRLRPTQFDVSRQVARDLGLYRRGRNYRAAQWRRR